MPARAAVWMVDADALAPADLQRYHAWLAPDEAARAQRFVRAERRRQFIAGRALARVMLAPLFGVAPAAVTLHERPGLGPAVAVPPAFGAAPGLCIAHSGRWVACAVSAQAALGLDIELRDPARDLDALAAQAFDGADLAQWTALRAQGGSARVDAFYRLWSAQEARIKLNRPHPGACMVLPHGELAVALCSDPPLACAPQLELVTLP
jgi:4'-phosphopantetheinyl transferase